ncbi:uncharacterized protein LOC106059046 isoform X4 [Biomphalaria glabrata]|uniref:Uncharacterized protein LOC106059046 isoform X4 n=1 Tax=Biomphalaria glabrata TaxID=6526 RepID=A0A9W2ZS62_BIOGL|nr:uncharacterized protein LOC106059046 isoform X4 [Biomphalaria glabrata]
MCADTKPKQMELVNETGNSVSVDNKSDEIKTDPAEFDNTAEDMMTDMKLEDEIDEVRSDKPDFNWLYHIEIYPWNADDMTENFIRLIKLAQFSQICLRKKGVGKETDDSEKADDKLSGRLRIGCLHLYTDTSQNAKNIMRSATWKTMAAKQLVFELTKQGPSPGQLETAALEVDTYLVSKSRFRDKPKGGWILIVLGEAAAGPLSWLTRVSPSMVRKYLLKPMTRTPWLCLHLHKRAGPGMPVPMTGRQKMNEKLRRNNFGTASLGTGLLITPGTVGNRGSVLNPVGNSFKLELESLQNQLEQSTQALEAKIAMLQQQSTQAAAYYHGNILTEGDWEDEELNYNIGYSDDSYVLGDTCYASDETLDYHYAPQTAVRLQRPNSGSYVNAAANIGTLSAYGARQGIQPRGFSVGQMSAAPSLGQSSSAAWRGDQRRVGSRGRGQFREAVTNFW